MLGARFAWALGPGARQARFVVHTEGLAPSPNQWLRSTVEARSSTPESRPDERAHPQRQQDDGDDDGLR
jgi:hypothetical protein